VKLIESINFGIITDFSSKVGEGRGSPGSILMGGELYVSNHQSKLSKVEAQQKRGFSSKQKAVSRFGQSSCSRLVRKSFGVLGVGERKQGRGGRSRFSSKDSDAGFRGRVSGTGRRGGKGGGRALKVNLKEESSGKRVRGQAGTRMWWDKRNKKVRPGMGEKKLTA